MHSVIKLIDLLLSRPELLCNLLFAFNVYSFSKSTPPAIHLFISANIMGHLSKDHNWLIILCLYRENMLSVGYE